MQAERQEAIRVISQRGLKTPIDFSSAYHATEPPRSPETDGHTLTVFLSDTVVPADPTLLGGKAAGLVRFNRIINNPQQPEDHIEGVGVPPGFTMITRCYHLCHNSGSLDGDQRFDPALPDQLQAELHSRMRELEETTGRKFGSKDKPLIVSARSGAKFSLPGAMSTITGIGINDETVGALAKEIGEEASLECYLTAISGFGKDVCGIDGRVFKELAQSALSKHSRKRLNGLPVDELQALVQKAKSILSSNGHEFPQDVQVQLALATKGVFNSWNSPDAISQRQVKKISHDLGTTVTIQQMAFGNDIITESGSMVLLTRNTATGEAATVDIAPSQMGTALVDKDSHAKPLQISEIPEPFRPTVSELIALTDRHYSYPQEMEIIYKITPQGEINVSILQTRDETLSPLATFRWALERYQRKEITQEEARKSLTTEDLSRIIFHEPPINLELTKEKGRYLGSGLSLSPERRRYGTVIHDISDSKNYSDDAKLILIADLDTTDLEKIARTSNIKCVVTSHSGAGSHFSRRAADLIAVGIGVIISADFEKIPEPQSHVTVDLISGYIVQGKAIVTDQHPNGLLSETEQKIATSWRRFKKNHPWHDAQTGLSDTFLRMVAQEMSWIRDYSQSLKETEIRTFMYHAPEGFPEDPRIPYWVFEPDKLEDTYNQAKQIIENQKPLQEEVSFRSCHNPPLPGTAPWIGGIKTIEEAREAVYEPLPEGEYGPISSWKDDRSLRAVIVGAFPKDNLDPSSLKDSFTASIAITPAGVIALEIRPGQKMRATNTRGANIDDTVRITTRYSPNTPNHLETPTAVIGQNVDPSFAHTAVPIIADHVFGGRNWEIIASTMAKVDASLPKNLYPACLEILGRYSPSEGVLQEGQEQEIGTRWIRWYGINADRKKRNPNSPADQPQQLE